MTSQTKNHGILRTSRQQLDGTVRRAGAGRIETTGAEGTQRSQGTGRSRAEGTQRSQGTGRSRAEGTQRSQRAGRSITEGVQRSKRGGQDSAEAMGFFQRAGRSIVEGVKRSQKGGQDRVEEIGHSQRAGRSNAEGMECSQRAGRSGGEGMERSQRVRRSIAEGMERSQRVRRSIAEGVERSQRAGPSSVEVIKPSQTASQSSSEAGEGLQKGTEVAECPRSRAEAAKRYQGSEQSSAGHRNTEDSAQLTKAGDICETCSLTPQAIHNFLKAAGRVSEIADSVIANGGRGGAGARGFTRRPPTTDSDLTISETLSHRSLKDLTGDILHQARYLKEYRATNGGFNGRMPPGSDTSQHTLLCRLMTLQRMVGDMICRMCDEMAREGVDIHSLAELKFMRQKYTNISKEIIHLVGKESTKVHAPIKTKGNMKGLKEALKVNVVRQLGGSEVRIEGGFKRSPGQLVSDMLTCLCPQTGGWAQSREKTCPGVRHPPQPGICPRCSRTRPHLHGQFNGVPIVLKLPAKGGPRSGGGKKDGVQEKRRGSVQHESTESISRSDKDSERDESSCESSSDDSCDYSEATKTAKSTKRSIPQQPVLSKSDKSKATIESRKNSDLSRPLMSYHSSSIVNNMTPLIESAMDWMPNKSRKDSILYIDESIKSKSDKSRDSQATVSTLNKPVKSMSNKSESPRNNILAGQLNGNESVKYQSDKSEESLGSRLKQITPRKTSGSSASGSRHKKPNSRDPTKINVRKSTTSSANSPEKIGSPQKGGSAETRHSLDSSKSRTSLGNGPRSKLSLSNKTLGSPASSTKLSETKKTRKMSLADQDRKVGTPSIYPPESVSKEQRTMKLDDDNDIPDRVIRESARDSLKSKSLSFERPDYENISVEENDFEVAEANKKQNQDTIVYRAPRTTTQPDYDGYTTTPKGIRETKLQPKDNESSIPVAAHTSSMLVESSGGEEYGARCALLDKESDVILLGQPLVVNGKTIKPGGNMERKEKLRQLLTELGLEKLGSFMGNDDCSHKSSGASTKKTNVPYCPSLMSLPLSNEEIDDLIKQLVHSEQVLEKNKGVLIKDTGANPWKVHDPEVRIVKVIYDRDRKTAKSNLNDAGMRYQDLKWSISDDTETAKEQNDGDKANERKWRGWAKATKQTWPSRKKLNNEKNNQSCNYYKKNNCDTFDNQESLRYQCAIDCKDESHRIVNEKNINKAEKNANRLVESNQTRRNLVIAETEKSAREVTKQSMGKIKSEFSLRAKDNGVEQNKSLIFGSAKNTQSLRSPKNKYTGMVNKDKITLSSRNPRLTPEDKLMMEGLCANSTVCQLTKESPKKEYNKLQNPQQFNQMSKDEGLVNQKYAWNGADKAKLEEELGISARSFIGKNIPSSQKRMLNDKQLNHTIHKEIKRKQRELKYYAQSMFHQTENGINRFKSLSHDSSGVKEKKTVFENNTKMNVIDEIDDPYNCISVCNDGSHSFTHKCTNNSKTEEISTLSPISNSIRMKTSNPLQSSDHKSVYKMRTKMTDWCGDTRDIGLYSISKIRLCYRESGNIQSALNKAFNVMVSGKSCTNRIQIFESNRRHMQDNCGKSCLHLSSTSFLIIDTGRDVDKGNEIMTTGALQSHEDLRLTINGDPCVLYDILGRPLTDYLGRPLVNLYGRTLVQVDDKGRPVSDANGGPVYDAFGRSSKDEHFDPTCRPLNIPHRRLVNVKGVPLLLHDILGRPVTSVSGKALANLFGNLQVLRIGSSMLCDSKGRKLYDVHGRAMSDLDFDPTSQLIPISTRCSAGAGNDWYVNNRCHKTLAQQRKMEDLDLQKHCSKTKKTDKSRSFSSTIDSVRWKALFDHSDSVCATQGTQSTAPELETKRMFLHKECQIPGKHSMDLTDNLHKRNASSDSNISSTCKSRESGNGLAEKESISGPSQRSRSLYKRFSEFILDWVKSAKQVKPDEVYCDFLSFNQKQKYKSSSVKGKKSRHSNDANMKTENNQIIRTTGKLIVEDESNNTGNDIFGASLVDSRQRPIYNNYGQPILNLLGLRVYDKYGMPKAGAYGKPIQKVHRRAMAATLLGVPPSSRRVNKNFKQDLGIVLEQGPTTTVDFNGRVYDKFGRPLFDQYGYLQYDFTGRPLFDGYGRQLTANRGTAVT